VVAARSKQRPAPGAAPGTRSASAKRAAARATPPTFRSAKEARGVFDSLLRRIERDPEAAAKLSAAAAPLRIEITDLDLVVNIGRAEEGGVLKWDFSRRSPLKPKLRLSMDGEVCNRIFQGCENPAIAIARGRLRARAEGPSAALRFFPATRPMVDRYRKIVAEAYPHLAIE